MFIHLPFARPLQLILSLVLAIALLYSSSVGAARPSMPTILPQAGAAVSHVPSLRNYANLPIINVSDVLAHGKRSAAAQALSPAAIGTGGAEMQISPHVVAYNTGYAIFSVSGFLPGETVNFFLIDVAIESYPADGNGFISFALNNFPNLGVPQFPAKAVGVTSGRVAGDSIIASTNGEGQAAAAVPHAVRHGDPLLLFGTGYPPGGLVAVRHGLNFTGVISATAEGNVAVELTTDPAALDGSAVYNLDLTGNSGSLDGASIEERADAGPPTGPDSDRAPTRAFVDQATGPTSGAYFAVGAEGFQPGETVRVTRLSDNQTLLNMTANTIGVAASSLNLTGSSPTETDMLLTGLTSGKRAWASVLLDDDGISRPGALLVPATAPSGQSSLLLFTKLTPSTSIDIYFDANVYTTTTADANGLITTTLTTDTSLPLDVHSVNSQDTSNANADIAAAALTTLGSPGSLGTLTGRVSDAATTLGITGTVTINGVTTPTLSNGNYSIPNIPVGTYAITATANSGCYAPLTQTVSLGTGSTKVNFPLHNICITTTPTPVVATPTNTPTAAPTNTPGGPTNTPAPTNTPVPTSTTPPTNTPGGPTDTPAPTNTPLPTNTSPPTNTPGGPTDTPMPTDTPGGPTDTPMPTDTPGGPTITPTDCPNPFVDITGNVFYVAIHYLSCHHVVNGTDSTHYSPAGTSTRGQFAKVVVLGFGLILFTPSGGVQDFTDVPTSYFAYTYIETGYANHILSGFDQNSCTAHQAVFPCYLPNLPITRGQLTKLVVNAAHYPLFTPTGGNPTFTDVPPSNIFFVSIETAHSKGVINGYPDQTFRPNNNIRRDEMAQIVFKGVTTP